MKNLEKIFNRKISVRCEYKIILTINICMIFGNIQINKKSSKSIFERIRKKIIRKFKKNID